MPSNPPQASVISAPPVRYCLYARKSSEDDERQALSIDSQVKELLAVAQRDGLEVAEVRRESHSAKASGTRPVFVKLLADIRSGEFTGILTWAADRLARNGGDLGAVVDLIDQKMLAEIRTPGQRFTNSPNDKFLLMILGSQAKLENDNKGVNVKRGLKTRAEQGLWPAVPPAGYTAGRTVGKECQVMVDPVRGPLIRQIFEKVALEGWSGRRAYKWLRDGSRYISPRGKPMSLSSVYNVLRTPFYAGTFEYPRGSGRWYEGKHETIITKEVFQKAQEKLNEETKPKEESHEFAFTRLMACGRCGSGITAMEKRKPSGKVYVYYACTRHRDKDCANPYLRETDLVEQLVGLIEQVELDEIGARQMLEREVARYNEMRRALLGTADDDSAKDMDLRRYAQHILRNGSHAERRAILENLRNRITVTDRCVTLEGA